MDKKNKKQKKKTENIWIFPSLVIAIYVALFFVDQDKTLHALEYAANLFADIVPILFAVLFFMFLFNLIDDKKLKNLIDKSPKAVKYIAMLLLGTFSHGPVYAWYPLMKEFRKKGISYGSIAIFLYARGIKLSLLPMLAIYFGFKYTLVLTIVMAVFSCIQGLMVDAVMKGHS